VGAHATSIERIARLADLGEGPWPTRALHAAGWSEDQVRHAVRSGRLVRVRKGMVDLPGSPGTAGNGLRSMLAAALETYPHAVGSHETAARLQKVWLPDLPSPVLHLTAPERPDRVPAGIRVHGSRLGSRWISEVDGLAVTSIPRTAVDVARGRSIERAVLVLDGAARQLLVHDGYDLRAVREDLSLRRRLTDEVRSELWSAYESERRWPFTVVVRTAIPLVDPASESPAESRSRIWFVGSDLPQPTIAAAVRGASGTTYFTDFRWEEYGVVGEVDGVTKYGSSESQVRRNLHKERRRQHDLEDDGNLVVRWDAVEPRTAMLTRVRRALRRRGWTP
jgi:hypothetical protein